MVARVWIGTSVDWRWCVIDPNQNGNLRVGDRFSMHTLFRNFEMVVEFLHDVLPYPANTL